VVPRPSWLPHQPRVGSLRDALHSYPLARKLPLTFSPARLTADLAAIPEAWWAPHAGPYHDGGWASVSLWAPRGDLREQRSFGGIFSATRALEACPYFSHVLAEFPGTRNRVRLMRLSAGSRILRHSDPLHTISPRLVRVHVPIVTAPDVTLRVNGTRIPLGAGEAWTIDVRFPHEVENRSTVDRVHLVIDLIRNAALETMLEQSVGVGRGLLLGYFVRHSLPRPVRRWLGNET
jgi:hypothetical protein